ncbi:hypothetical protein E3C22_16520 [Jiella endophytica]|uniref:Uncharacterized protein n=1 Tax=Jiella endophytica TaxID=2558362 RepID=A0A4Y8RFM5_9HYPH|nr:hypothetical protein [Jiella endophytica]TFF20513.1 hypothetical protein E3C22_16520 [Jiella endophytica]
MTAARESKDLRARVEISLPKGEEAIWAMIQKLDREGCWSTSDVSCFVGHKTKVIANYVARLESAGYVRRVGRSKVRGEPTLYEIARPSIFAPRISSSGDDLPELVIETLWRTMRMLKVFRAEDLAAYLAETGRAPNVKSIRVYLWRLHGAGLLAFAGKRGQRQEQRFRLVRIPGPRAPKVLTANVVWDPNRGEPLGTAQAEEAGL